MNLPKEIAKALIFDAAFGWDNNKRYQKIIGYGVVPKHISDIIKTKDDEIKLGVEANVPFEDTWTCYNPTDNKPCKKCASCAERIAAFNKAGVEDGLYE